MKKLITNLIFILICTRALAQSGTISIRIEEFCGELTMDNFKIFLYEILPGDTIVIDSTVGNMAEFNNIKSSTRYQIGVKPLSASEISRNIINAGLIKRYILGDLSQDEFLLIILAGDINGQSGLTTIDLVLLARYYIGIETNIPTTARVVRTNVKDNIFPDEMNKFIIETDAAGNYDLSLLNIRTGDVISTTKDYCRDCPKEDQMAEGLIQVYDQRFFEFEENNLILRVSVPENQLEQIIFKLNFQDAYVLYVTGFQSINYNISPDDKSLTIYIQNELAPNESIPVFIKYFPLRNGKLHEILSLDTGYFNQVTYQDSSCLKWSSAVSLQFDNFIKDCVINWPQNTTFGRCVENPFSGLPSTEVNCPNKYQFSYTDQNFNCEEFYRVWSGKNEFGEVTTHTQKIAFNENHTFLCKNSFEINIDNQDQRIELRVSDLLEKSLPETRYSFEKTNENDTVRIFSTDNIPVFLAVYNLDTEEVCYSLLEIQCNIVPPALKQDTFYFIYDHNLSISPDDLYDGPTKICLDTLHIKLSLDGIEFKDKIRISDSLVNKFLPVIVRYFVGEKLIKNYEIYLYVERADFQICVPKEWLEKGKTYAIPVTVKKFKNVTGFQLGLKVSEGEILSIEDKNPLLQNMMFNLSSEKVFILWVHQIALSVNLEDNDTLFTIRLLSNVDDWTSNVINFSEGFNSEGVIHPNYPVEIVLCYDDIVNSKDYFLEGINITDRIIIWPNPLMANELFIQKPKYFESENYHQLAIFNSVGSLMKTWGNIFNNIQSDIGILALPTDLPNGVYLVHLIQGGRNWIEKLVILR